MAENFQDNVVFGGSTLGVSGNAISLGTAGGAKSVIFNNSDTVGHLAWNPTANRTINLPDAAGTLLLSSQGILSISGGTTRITSGEVVFSNSNNVSWTVNGQTINASASQSVQTQGITGDQLSIGVSTGGNTAGNTTVQTGQRFVFVGTNGVSLSQTTGAGSTTLSFIGNVVSNAIQSVGSATGSGTNVTRFAADDHVHAGVFSMGVSTGGNTSGDTRVDVGRFVFAGGNNITLSQATAAGGLNTITISAGAGGGETRMTAYATSNTTQSSTGTIPFSSYIFAGAGAASVGISNGSVVISAPNAGAGNVTFSAGTTSAGLASLVFSDSNNISFGLNGSTITASGKINVSAGTTSNDLSKLTFANSNGVTFGLNASTITASIPLNATQSRWFNMIPGLMTLAGTVQGNSLVSVLPLQIEQDVAFSQMKVAGSVAVVSTTNNSSAYLDLTMSAVLYTRNATTLSSILSGSQSYTVSWSSNATGTAGGMKELTASFSASTALTPGEYWLALHISTTNSATGGANTTALGNSLSMGIVPGGASGALGAAVWGDTNLSTRGNFPGLGVISTGATRASIHLSAITQSGTRAVVAGVFVDLRNYTLW